MRSGNGVHCSMTGSKELDSILKESMIAKLYNALEAEEEARACLAEDLPVCYDRKKALSSLGHQRLAALIDCAESFGAHMHRRAA